MNVTHERNRALLERLRGKKLLTPAIAAELEQPWVSNGVIGQTVFFILTLIALGAFYGTLAVAEIPGKGLITGLVAIVVAEYLIRATRWFGTGAESALWIAGLIAFISELEPSGAPESILVIGAAFAVAGARVRNPLFGAVATLCLLHYCEGPYDAGVLAALLMATGALLALLRTWQRPSNEWLWIAIALTCPFAGIVYAGSEWRTVTILLYASFGAIALTLALLRRHHAFFLAAMIGISVAAIELARMLPAIAVEAKLAIGGALLLALSFAVSRTLRGRTTGFVLTPESLTPVDDELQHAATLVMQPATTEPPADTSTGGGSFGGAGASGDY